MTDSIRNLPRYIRQTDAFGWQGADSANGPWRPITPPQDGTPWQTTSPMNNLRQASAAQAVLDAVCDNTEPDCDTQHLIAAALRAVADQVVPIEAEIDPIKAWSIEDWNHMNTKKYQREETRRQLLAIAAELEAHG